MVQNMDERESDGAVVAGVIEAQEMQEQSLHLLASPQAIAHHHLAYGPHEIPERILRFHLLCFCSFRNHLAIAMATTKISVTSIAIATIASRISNIFAQMTETASFAITMRSVIVIHSSSSSSSSSMKKKKKNCRGPKKISWHRRRQQQQQRRRNLSAEIWWWWWWWMRCRIWWVALISWLKVT